MSRSSLNPHPQAIPDRTFLKLRAKYSFDRRIYCYTEPPEDGFQGYVIAKYIWSGIYKRRSMHSEQLPPLDLNGGT